MTRKRLTEVSDNVIKRRVRMRMAKHGQSVGRKYARYRLLIKERKRQKLLRKVFTLIRTQSFRFRREGYEATLTIYNVALYFLIAERDIQAIKIDALTHPDPWKRGLFTRMILLTIYERDVDKVAGVKLQKAFDLLQIPRDLRDEATDAFRAIRKVQEKAQKELNPIRNAIIAHRDPDALLQCRLIEQLDIVAIFQLAADFYAGADRFINLVPKLIIHAASMQSLLRQILDKGKP